MQHLDEGTIHAWLDGALDAEESARVERHASECATCAAAVAEARGLIAGASRLLSALDSVPGGVIPRAGSSEGAATKTPPTFAEARAAAEARRATRAPGAGSLWRMLHVTPARAAAAAVLLVAVGTTYTLRHGAQNATTALMELPSLDSAASSSADRAVAVRESAQRDTTGAGAGAGAGAAVGARVASAPTASPPTASASAASASATSAPKAGLSPSARPAPARSPAVAAAPAPPVPQSGVVSGLERARVASDSQASSAAATSASRRMATAADAQERGSAAKKAASVPAVRSATGNASDTVRRELLRAEPARAPDTVMARAADVVTQAPAQRGAVAGRSAPSVARPSALNQVVVTAAPAAANAAPFAGGCYAVVGAGTLAPARLVLEVAADEDRRDRKELTAQSAVAGTVSAVDEKGGVQPIDGASWTWIPGNGGTLTIVLGAQGELRVNGSSLEGVLRRDGRETPVRLRQQGCVR